MTSVPPFNPATVTPVKHKRGTCRYCGCTEKRACVLNFTSNPAGEFNVTTCAWWDAERTICSSSYCIADAMRDGYDLETRKAKKAVAR